MRQKELDREAERERERKREQEIRAFREFSTKLPLKQTPTAAPPANNGGGMGTSRRSRESSFANDGLTPLQHAPPSLGPLQPTKADSLNGPNSLAPIVGNVPPLSNFGSFGKFLLMRAVFDGFLLTNILIGQGNGPNGFYNNTVDPLTMQGVPRKTPRTHIPPLDSNANNNTPPGVLSVAQPPSSLMNSSHGVNGGAGNNGLRSRGGVRPAMQQLSSIVPPNNTAASSSQQQRSPPPQLGQNMPANGFSPRFPANANMNGPGNSLLNQSFQNMHLGHGNTANNPMMMHEGPPPSRSRMYSRQQPQQADAIGGGAALPHIYGGGPGNGENNFHQVNYAGGMGNNIENGGYRQESFKIQQSQPMGPNGSSMLMNNARLQPPQVGTDAVSSF